MNQTIQGIIIGSKSNIHFVLAENQTYLATLRKKEKRRFSGWKNLVATGDRVEVTIIDQENCVIEKILPRESFFGRLSAGQSIKKEVVQIIACNIDTVIVFLACESPGFKAHSLDRYLINIQRNSSLKPLIVFNKLDLAEEDFEESIQYYRKANYPIECISCLKNENLKPLIEKVKSTNSVIVGPSGGGKSTFLSILLGKTIKTGEISHSSNKGKHTTTDSTLYFMDDSEHWIIDTPGIKELGISSLCEEDLELFFPEIFEVSQHCRFNNCRHITEPQCKVREKAETDPYFQKRLTHYLKLKEEIPSEY